MKIGILTFHFAHNYGAMLQAYALSTKLRNMGYDAEIIDYRLPYIYYYLERLDFKGFYKRYRRKNNVVISLLKAIKNYRKHINKPAKWYRFESFLSNYLKKTSRIENEMEISSLDFDAIVCGSDQIWNNILTGQLVPLYFCDGIKSDCIKISYAASNGNEKVEEADWAFFKKYVKNFNCLSVREEGLSQFLTSRGISNEIVLDPIFLLNKEEWASLSCPIEEKNYLLTYSFQENTDFFMEAKKMADKMGLQLVCLVYKRNKLLDNSIIQVDDCGPIEFVSYFRHATFVITNSFHGTAFSILMQKPFYSVPPQKGRERIDSILGLLGLENRIVDKEFNIDSVIEYQKVNIKLNRLREQSIDYLQKSLKIQL